MLPPSWIAQTKVSVILKDGDIITKEAWYTKTPRSKAEHVQNCGELPEQRQGIGGMHESLLDDPQVKSAVKAFVDGMPVGKVSMDKPQCLECNISPNPTRLCLYCL